MKLKGILTASLALTALVFPTPAYAEGRSPIAENIEISTYRGIAVDGNLKAVDPDGDTLSFQITTPPIKGEVTLADNGSFVYSPDPSRRGKDYFGYTATDTNGNVSQEATVIITLCKQKTDVTYLDLTDSPIHYDAIRLAEEDIFVGQQLGGAYIFSPDTMISRGEFLSMCVQISQLSLPTAVSSTGFSDDAHIPPWQKPYIAAALMNGSLSYTTETGNSTFDSTAPITCAQAAVLVDRIFGISAASAASLPITSPDWAAQSVANLIACDILPKNCDTAQYINRSMTADMLSAVMDVLENR